MATPTDKKKTKIETKGAKAGNGLSGTSEEYGSLATTEDVKAFLHTILDKMREEVAAPIYVVSAMNHVMNLPQIYKLLDKESKEIARDIWLRLKANGLQVRNPSLLFEPEEIAEEKI